MVKNDKKMIGTFVEGFGDGRRVTFMLLRYRERSEGYNCAT